MSQWSQRLTMRIWTVVFWYFTWMLLLENKRVSNIWMLKCLHLYRASDFWCISAGLYHSTRYEYLCTKLKDESCLKIKGWFSDYLDMFWLDLLLPLIYILEVFTVAVCNNDHFSVGRLTLDNKSTSLSCWTSLSSSLWPLAGNSLESM